MKNHNKSLVLSLVLLIMICLPLVSLITIKDRAPVDILDRRLQTSENISWETNGTIICDAAASQTSPQIVSDGDSGAIIVWKDGREGSGEEDIYAQKIDSTGQAQWTTNGSVICNATDNQFSPQLVSDSAGGAIITWIDNRPSTTSNDIYAQKINSGGVVQWDVNGTVICNATSSQGGPQIVSDGAGGAIISWYDYRTSGTTGVDIYSQKINSAGEIQWNTNGTVICNATG